MCPRADPAFLDFFFARLRPNATGRHAAFAYTSACGHELNFLRAEDQPVVFHRLVASPPALVYAGTLATPFEPARLHVADNGRLYYPSPRPELGPWGLVGSYLARELEKHVSQDA